MKFSVLSSGSKANATYIETHGVRILIDCGLSGRQAALRLAALGVAIDQIDAIFVTHEHHDHIHGVATLSRRYRIPVYGNEGSLEKLKEVYRREIFTTGDLFTVTKKDSTHTGGEIAVSPFRITHDAVDPVGYTILSEGLKFTQATDLGKVTPLVKDALTGCNAIVLESNYDPIMLQDCDYSWELKQRIASTHGHLSNGEASAVLTEVLHPELSHIVLGHLSENSNTPEHALREVAPVRESRYAPHVECGCISNATRLFTVEPQISSLEQNRDSLLHHTYAP
jgi:phosphoribosyl 1,2-cyclic phosphodiesterase